MVRLSLVLLMTYLPAASAKYRAYRLLIVNEEAGTEKEVLSTMDHIQYPGYYHLNKGETIQYLDSWMCWGNTSNFKPICPNVDSRQPASSPALPNPGDA